MKNKKKSINKSPLKDRNFALIVLSLFVVSYVIIYFLSLFILNNIYYYYFSTSWENIGYTSNEKGMLTTYITSSIILFILTVVLSKLKWSSTSYILVIPSYISVILFFSNFLAGSKIFLSNQTYYFYSIFFLLLYSILLWQFEQKIKNKGNWQIKKQKKKIQVRQII